MKRKYTDGSYFSKSGSVQLKNIHSQPAKNPHQETFSALASKPYEPLTDTIIMSSGKRVPCKVKTITRKNIVYTDNKPGPSGSNKTVRNKNVKRINFENKQKEYFTERNPEANPLLQYGLLDTGDRNNGMAIFGGVCTTVLGSVLLFGAAAIGILLLSLGLLTLIGVSAFSPISDGYKALNLLGKVFGVLFLTAFAIGLAIIVIAIIAFA